MQQKLIHLIHRCVGAVSSACTLHVFTCYKSTPHALNTPGFSQPYNHIQRTFLHTYICIHIHVHSLFRREIVLQKILWMAFDCLRVSPRSHRGECCYLKPLHVAGKYDTGPVVISAKVDGVKFPRNLNGTVTYACRFGFHMYEADIPMISH